MRAGFAPHRSAGIAGLDRPAASGRSRPSPMARIREVWAICGRAWAAAHHYETMRPLSDQALAARGLTRADLPRAAFRKLTGTP